MNIIQRSIVEMFSCCVENIINYIIDDFAYAIHEDPIGINEDLRNKIFGME